MKSVGKFIPKFAGKPSFWLIIAIIIAAAGGYGVYKYTSLAGSIIPTKSDATLTADETTKLIQKVSKIYLLPTGETPTIATVADKDKLSNQQFFQNAQNGDRVLIYQKARKAIIFRPSTNQIIEIGPVNIAPSVAATASSSQRESSTYKFVILNGTKVVGLTKKYEPILVSKIPYAEIVDRDNSKNDYEKSILVDVKGGRNELAQSFAAKLNLKFADLPSGEVKPKDVDFLVFLGLDSVPTATPTPTTNN